MGLLRLAHPTLCFEIPEHLIRSSAATFKLPSIGRTDVPSVIIMSGEDA